MLERIPFREKIRRRRLPSNLRRSKEICRRNDDRICIDNTIWFIGDDEVDISGRKYDITKLQIQTSTTNYPLVPGQIKEALEDFNLKRIES